MEFTAPFQEEGWRCDRDCRAGSSAVAAAVGKLGTNLGDLGILQEAESTVIAFNNCGGPSIGEVNVDKFVAELVCPLANVTIDTTEICERVQ